MTVVVSKGRAVPLFDRKAWPGAGISQPGTVTSSRALELIGLDLNVDYASIYASQPWIYAVVNKVTRNIARLPLLPQREDPQTYYRERLPRTHPLPALLSRPFPRGSTFRLVESAVGSLMIFGHGLWWKYRVRPGQPPVELWPLPWQNISIEAGADVPIDFYRYRGQRGEKILFPDDVVHFTWWSPMGLRGTSPLEPLRSTLALEDAGRRYAIASFANGVRPSGALVTEKTIGDEAKKEIRAQLEGSHSSPDNAFRMMLLDGGLDWKPFSHTAQEAQTIEHRKLNQIEACAVYDMPPTMLQILDHATFSNIDEQHRMLYQDTLGPVVTNLEATIEAQLLWGEPQLGLAVDDDDNEIENTAVAFSMDDVLRADIVRRAAATAAMRAAGAYSINDIRLAEGKTKIDHPAADACLIPLNMVAVGDGGIIEFPAERITMASPGPSDALASPDSGGASDGTASALAALGDALVAKEGESGVEASILAARLLERALA